MNRSNGTHASLERLNGEEPREADHLRAENGELRSLVLELEQALQQHTGGSEDFDARAREYEALLEEKSDLIRNLHRKVQALEQEAASREEAPKADKKPVGLLPREEELMQ